MTYIQSIRLAFCGNVPEGVGSLMNMSTSAAERPHIGKLRSIELRECTETTQQC